MSYRPPRLLAVSQTAVRGGASAVLLRLLKSAAREGWIVACATPEGPLAHSVERMGLERLSIPGLGVGAGPRPAAVGALAIKTAAATVRLRRASASADVILANGLQAVGPFRLAPPRKPLVWLVHEVVTRSDRLHYLRLCAPAVDVGVGVSAAVVPPLRRAGIDTRVIRNGTAWPVPPAAPEGPPPIIGCNGALTPLKGQHVLLDAVAKMHRHVPLVELLGTALPKDGPYVERLKRHSERPPLAGRVRFCGHVSEPLAYMRRWSVMALPSVEPEAAPLSVLEAMSLGVPVVATDHGGPAEVLDGAGLLAPPADARSLGAALERLLDDEAERRRCGEAGRAAIAAGLTHERQERELLALLEELHRGPKAPRSGGA